jgi:hypothetical protein
MAKSVSQQHITAEKGVSKFQSFCACHNPFLIFREESKHDYGIDGEVELTKFTNVGKTEATGDILKIQLKSTKLKGYIANDIDNSFEFIAKSQDIEYWNSHPIPVILVVYFENEDLLFAKKIEKEFVLKNRGSHKIIFDKTANLLSPNTNFEETINQNFVSRIDFNITETLYINIHKIVVPTFIRQYKSKHTNPKKIAEIIKEHELYPTPKYVLNSDKLYTFQNLENYNHLFKNNVLSDSSCEQLRIKDFSLKGNNERNTIVWLVKQYLGEEFRKKKIFYNKDFDRYYFGKFSEEPLEVYDRGNSKTEVFRFEKTRGKSGKSNKRSVVAKYTYYETSHFFRHLGFQLFFEWIDNQLNIIFEPKYLYTEDGKTPLISKERVTRLTNQLKQTERNTQYINHIVFLRNYFDLKDWCVFFENDTTKIEIKHISKEIVNFGIKENSVSNNRKQEIENNNQTSLF